MAVPNDVRSFSMYEVLERSLNDFLRDGDGVDALPVYEERYYEDANVVDCTLINLVKLLSTAYGRTKIAQGSVIEKRIYDENPRKKSLRFRSQHPLFTDGSSRYQNVCLISGMVYLGIPIFPYFDGESVLNTDDDYDERRALVCPTRDLQ